MSDKGTGGLNESQVMHAMSIDDAYRVEQVLARGACGVTELVTIDGTGPFVRKKIDREQARRSVWAILADCQCRFLPQVRATYEMPEWFVVVYDFVPGETLEHRVARTGALPADEAVRMVQNVCVAVGELHAHGVIHRDLSPANIVLSSDGAHVIDLGIARTLADRSPGISTPYGTMGFASPEQYGFDGIKTDARSDVYSIGRLLDFALTGVRSEDARHATLLHDARVVPLRLREIIERACAFEPSARYQTVAQLGAAVDQSATGGTAAEAVLGGTDARSEPGMRVAEGERDRLRARTASAAGSSTWGSQPPQPIVGPHAASESDEQAKRDGVSKFARIALVVCASAATLVLLFGASAHFAGSSFSLLGLPGLVSMISEGAGQDGANGTTASSNVEGEEGSASAGTYAAPSGLAQNSDAAAVQSQLQVVESEWHANSSSYIDYVFALRNNSSEWAVELFEVSIIGRAEDGSVLFTDGCAVPYAGPGETVYYANMAGRGTVPAQVEFEVKPLQQYQVVAPDSSGVSYAASDLSAVPDGYEGMSFTGEVRLEGAGAAPAVNGLLATVVLRDASGAMVGGSMVDVSPPSEGSTTPFEVYFFKVPDYATAEVHLISW